MYLDILGYFPVIRYDNVHICYNKGFKYNTYIIFKSHAKREVCYRVLLYIYIYSQDYVWGYTPLTTYSIIRGVTTSQFITEMNISDYILCKYSVY